MAALERGDLPPRIRVEPPGPRSRAVAERLRRWEAPGINTLHRDLPSIVWSEALGANVVDLDGNRYVDLTSGFGAAAIGHRNPRVVAAIGAQAGLLVHGLGDVHAQLPRVVLAERLATLAPLADAAVYFAVSGSDAVEIALKTSFLATGKPGVVAFSPAYHGLSLGALAVTSRAHFRDPFIDRLAPHVVRLPYSCPPQRLAECLTARVDVGAVIVEPIVGRDGVLLPPPGWLANLAEICHAHGCLFIVDEILTGFGRTGSLFAVTAEGVRPDLLCCGKALGGGMPIAAVIGRREILESWRSPEEARHTATFVAHPLACAAALAVLDVLETSALVRRAVTLGDRVAARLAPWGAFPEVLGIRGRGLLWGIELHHRQLAADWSSAARRRGILALVGGVTGSVLELLPPLSISEQQLDLALDLLLAALAEVVGRPIPPGG